MIKLIFGNVGSGKTASVVRWMLENKHLCILTNIHTKKMPHVIHLTPNMILKKEQKSVKRSGMIEYDLKLNIDFWQEFIKKHENINVVIDEAHTFFNPRRSMSKINIIMGDFLALLRRILGGIGQREGKLILITQLSRRLDIIAREMATDVQFTKHYYMMTCKKCFLTWHENNEMSNIPTQCPRCSHPYLIKGNSVIEIFCFKNSDAFTVWYETRSKTFYKHYYITDIEKVFNLYNTLQWDDLLTEF